MPAQQPRARQQRQIARGVNGLVNAIELARIVAIDQIPALAHGDAGMPAGAHRELSHSEPDLLSLRRRAGRGRLEQRARRLPFLGQ